MRRIQGLLAPLRAVLARFLPQGAILLSVLTFAAYVAGPPARPPVRPHLRGGRGARRLQRGVRPPGARARRPRRVRAHGPVRADLQLAAPRRSGRRRRGALRPDGPDARGHGDGRREPGPADPRAGDRAPHRPGLRRGAAGALPRAVPAHAGHADPVRRLDHAGRGAGRGAPVPVLRARARSSTTSASRLGRCCSTTRWGSRRPRSGPSSAPASTSGSASSASCARPCRCGPAWTCGCRRCASSCG